MLHLLLILALPAAWASLIYQVLLLVLPTAAGWIAGELTLFRQWIQALGGLWGSIAAAIVAGAVTALAAFLVARFPGITVPPDLSGFTPDVVLGILVAALKSLLGVSAHFRAKRLALGLRH